MKILVVSMFVVIIDQVSKFAVRYSFEYGRSQEIIDDLVRLTYVKNPGMAFGLQLGDQRFFTVFALIATIIIFVYIFRARAEKLPLRFALALILGGAVGNLIDRVLHQGVVDFIDIGIGSTRWPIFNLADCAVTIGMAVLLTLILLDKTQKSEATQNEVTSVKRSPLF